MQTLVNSDAEAISTDLFSRKGRKVSHTSSSESNWVGYPVEDHIEGEIHDSYDVSGKIMKIYLQTRELLCAITR